MKWRSIVGFLLFLAAGMHSAPSSSAQSDSKEKTCRAFPPSFADEINELRRETRRPFVEIAGVTLTGEGDLPSAVRMEIVRALEGKHFDSDSEWVGAAEGMTRDILQDQGYYQAMLKVEPHLAEEDSVRYRVVFDLHIDQGAQFRLRSIQFLDAKRFAPDELRKLFPLEDGELFSVVKIRKGIQALTRLYSSIGHIDSTVTPESEADPKKGLVALTLRIDEGPEFRIGKITILGLSQNIERSLELRPTPGDVFNWVALEEFFNENKNSFPSDASPIENVKIDRDMKANTVDIVLDFRPCRR